MVFTTKALQNRPILFALELNGLAKDFENNAKPYRFIFHPTMLGNLPWFQVIGLLNNLITDTESEIHLRISVVDLDWQDRCLEATSSDTSTRTASVWSAREQIYTHSKEHLRNYAKQLTSTIKILNKSSIVNSDGSHGDMPKSSA